MALVFIGWRWCRPIKDDPARRLERRWQVGWFREDPSGRFPNGLVLLPGQASAIDRTLVEVGEAVEYPESVAAALEREHLAWEAKQP